MNNTYRLIWNELANTWVAVAENAKSRGKRSAGALLLTAVASVAMAQTVSTQQLPTGGQIVSGSGAISAQGAAMTVNQNTARMITNWSSFNIGANASVNFVQPSASAVALNRIQSQDPTQIMGRLTANGQVMLVNPAGVVFGRGSQVDVGSLVASSLAISDANFLNGNYRFTANSLNTLGAVVNQGRITTANGGAVAFLAPVVKNEGQITTPKGSTLLAAAQDITVDFAGDGLISYRVNAGAANALVENTGTVMADGGMAVLSAQSVDSVTQGVVNNTGLVRAQRLENRDGRIVLEGHALVQTGTLMAPEINANVDNLINSGTWDASGVSNATSQGGHIAIQATGHVEQTDAGRINADGGAGQGGSVRLSAGHDVWVSGQISANGTQGGDVTVEAPSIVLAAAKVSATGQTANGGNIRIGGGYQGKDTDIVNAQTTRVVASELDVSVSQRGSAGQAVVWSESETVFGATVKAAGGQQSGNGGLVEVSSHDKLTFAGQVNVTAPAGTNGRLLLDPKNIEIVASVSPIQVLSLLDPSPFGNEYINGADQTLTTSGLATELLNAGVTTNRIVFRSPYDSTTVSKAGAVRLYNSQTGALISTLTGSSANDFVGGLPIVSLGNGNFVVRSQAWTNSASAPATPSAVTTGLGAVTFVNGTTGLNGVVSSANSLVGGSAGDRVGFGGANAVAVKVLTNGNYVVSTPTWKNGTYTKAGAVTWGSGSLGVSGSISSANSFVGTSSNDLIGSGLIYTSSAGGTSSSTYMGSDSLIESYAASKGITALTNGNYVVTSPYWAGGMGAVTWFDGATGLPVGGTAGNAGSVSSSNSLIGSAATHFVGSRGVTPLSNGNYVVVSSDWDNGATANVGAVTWGNGASGSVVGAVSANNSLIGQYANTYLGAYGTVSGTDYTFKGITELTGGQYFVVSSPQWRTGTSTTDANKGAVTRLPTASSSVQSTFGYVNATNSLVGSTAGDFVGRIDTMAGSISAYKSGVTPLALNDTFVVASPLWNGQVTSGGAVTWVGPSGLTGAVSTVNSLYGTTANDKAGYAGVYALTNGNYVTSSSLNTVGAVTWGDGTIGVQGAIGANNSLVGSSANDGVGALIVPLNNGNFVVGSPSWKNGAVSGAGAVTLVDGATGRASDGTVGNPGVVSSANSLVGSMTNDYVGNTIYALPQSSTTSNYVVLSPNWDRDFTIDPGTVGGTGTAANVGAVTWASGTVGVTGAVSILNSLIGSKANDKVGANSTASPFQALTNGNYVVSNPTWDNGTATDAGAATWGSGTAGVAGEISSANSLIGTLSNDKIGLQGAQALATGNYVVLSPLRKVGSYSGGAISWGNGVTGTVGTVTDQNSLLGIGNLSTAESIGGSDALALSDGRALVFSNYGRSGVANYAGRLDIISYLSPMPTLSDASAYATNSSLSQGVSASAINNAMSTGAAVTLQASNDIKVSSVINASTNTTGHLTLQAGRSILVNANITTGGANLTLKANEPLASGVVDAQRDAGAAEIKMASGTTLNAGNGNITLSLGAGTGLTESTSGNITLRTLLGNAISVVNAGATSGSSITSNNDITAASSLRLEADAGSVTVATYNIMAGAGSATLIARDDITLNSAITAPSGSTGGLTLLAGRSALLNHSINTTNGALTIKANHYDGTAAVSANRLAGAAEITMGTSGTIATGTGAVNISIMDGTGLTTNTSGSIGLKAITGGSLSVFNRGTTTGSAINITGTLNASGAIDIAAEYGNIALAGDLRTTNASGSAIRLNAGAAASAGTTAGGDITVSGTANGMPVIAMGTGATARFYSGSAVNSTSLSVIATAGSRFSSDETTTLSPVLGAGKYAIYRQNTTPITLTILGTSKDYGDLNPVLPNYALTSGSFNSGDSISAIAWGSAATQYKAVGTYAYGSTGLLSPTFACSVGSACASDYTITFVNGLTINPRPITVTASPLSKFYGAADPALTYQITSGNLVSTDTLSGALTRSVGAHAGTYPINVGSLAASSNYAVNYVSANLTINPAVLTVMLTNTGVTKTYDGTNVAPAGFSPTYSVSGAGSDAVTLSNAGVAYNSAHVVAANKVTVYGLAVSGVTGSNSSLPSDYILDASSKDVAASITPQALTVSANIGGSLNKAYDGNAMATGARVSGTVTGSIAGDTLSVDGSRMTLTYGGIEGASMIRASGRSGLRVDQTLSSSLVSDYSFTDPTIADVSGEIGRKPAQNSPIPPTAQSNAVNATVDLNVEMKKEKVVAVADVIASAKVVTEAPQMKLSATLTFGVADSLGMELVVSSNAASLTTVDSGPAKTGSADDSEVKTNSVALFNQTGDKVSSGGALSIVEQGKNMRASVTTADTAPSLNVNLAGMRFVNVDFKLPSGAPNQLSVGVSADGMLVVKVPPAMKASSDDRSLALIGMATAKERLDVQPSSVKGVVIQVE